MRERSGCGWKGGEGPLDRPGIAEEYVHSCRADVCSAAAANRKHALDTRECPIYPTWLLGKRHACVRARSCVCVRIDVHSLGRGAGNGNGRMSEQTNSIYTLKRGSGTCLCGACPWWRLNKSVYQLLPAAITTHTDWLTYLRRRLNLLCLIFQLPARSLQNSKITSALIADFLSLFLYSFVLLCWSKSKVNTLPPSRHSRDHHALANMQSWAPRQCHDETQSGPWCEGQTQWPVLANSCSLQT